MGLSFACQADDDGALLTIAPRQLRQLAEQAERLGQNCLIRCHVWRKPEALSPSGYHLMLTVDAPREIHIKRISQGKVAND